MGAFKVKRSGVWSLSEVDPRVGSAGQGIPNKALPNTPSDPPTPVRSKLKSKDPFRRKELASLGLIPAVDPPGNVGSSPLVASGISAPGGSQWNEPSASTW